MATCGISAGAQDTFFALREELKKRGLPVPIKKTGCVGRCSAEPLVEVSVDGRPPVAFQHLTADRAGELVDRLLVQKAGWEEQRVVLEDTRQMRVVLRNCGIVDPENIRDYIARDGFVGLAKALTTLKPEDVIEEIKKSGLRGRGGAGFPTGLKWAITRQTPADQRYVICNGDEGDPGAYMDRGVLEGDPYSVIEGMLIAGYAMGADQGFFYIRAEYPLAVERIEKAIKQCRAQGVLGKNVLGTSFSFDLDIRLGAGAFVCGEETALIASIEGRRGYPEPRPPYPSVKGLWDKPTCINNVETLANLPAILDKGSAWFSSIGIDKSKGTKVFAVTGKVRHAGLVEVPMGTTLRAIVYDIGGGAAGGKKVKAVQTGGPSGGVIPEALFDTPVGYENLLRLGSIMGSGGMIVMDEDDSIVELTKFYLGFCVDESCGKCAPCRIGGTQMLRILNRIVAGEGVPEDLEKLKTISQAMQKASLCGLGQTAPNPVLSTLRYFEHEYRALIKVPAPTSR
ncbi:MAG: SLBB domain-containing protein [Elusimicrobia bacterium]|nr:SLBB domain-containing protein [Elusimicrobiota bacterium]